MSAVNITEAKNLLKPEQVTVQNLLIENGQLIEAVAEYQRMGRIIEATKYQEKLHANLIYLAKLADSTCSSHLLQEMGAAAEPTNQSTPPQHAEPLLTAPGMHQAPMANATVPYQQQLASAPLTLSAGSHMSPPSGHGQQHNSTSTTPPNHMVQYQFPSPAQSSPNVQTNQPQQPTAYQQQQSVTAAAVAMPFQRNLNVPPHSMLFQHQQQNIQQSQQQITAQQHPIVYATGHAMQNQQYSAYPLLQQQPSHNQHQFPSSIQAHFPPPTTHAYAPVVISTQSDPTGGIRLHQQTYQNSQILHGASPGAYMAQQK